MGFTDFEDPGVAEFIPKDTKRGRTVKYEPRRAVDSISGLSGFNGQIDLPARRNEVTHTRAGLFAVIQIHLNVGDGTNQITVVNS